ncbi:MAG: type II secretion system F family protein, partial [Magnetococcales bacterium]|nr:type II secretion system F family protein [Magnetococcales bacterium]
MPIELDEPTPKKRSKTGKGLSFQVTKQKIASKEILFFAERLSLLLDTGNTLHISLELLAEQFESGLMRETILKIQEDVTGGLSLSQSLAKYPEVFSRTHVQLVHAGEQGGFVPQVLTQLSEMEEKRDKLYATLGG